MSEELRLAELCERAEGPDRELDARIAVAFDLESEWMVPHRFRLLHHDYGGNNSYAAIGKHHPRLPKFTGSIDAAMTLVPPADRWPWNVTMATFYGSASVIPNHGGSYGINDPHAGHGRAATPALALCAAALRARASRTGEGM